MRLERGAELLKDTGASVAAIAHRVGFRSTAHFSNRFTAHFGHRPSFGREAAQDAK
jgi:transcriptional regulator GlxA family with amidase domain